MRDAIVVKNLELRLWFLRVLLVAVSARNDSGSMMVVKGGGWLDGCAISRREIPWMV